MTIVDCIEVQADEARAALGKVLASPGFSKSARMSRFLRYAVEATLAGEEQNLKEVCVGMAVFDRAADYNPKVDPVVRNEARRLRAKLEQYYGAEGCADPVRISIPRGAYVACFEKTALAESAAEAMPEPLAPQPAGRSGRRWWIAGLAVAFAAGGCLLAVSLTHPAAPEFAGVRFRYLTSLPTREIQPSISPDGQRVLYSSDEEGAYGIYVTTLDGQSTRVTRSGSDELRPAWSPDGRLFAFLRASGDGFDVIISPLTGGGERKVGRIGKVRLCSPPNDVLLAQGSPGPAWSPDGSELAFSNGLREGSEAAIELLQLNSGRQRWLTHPAQGETDFYPAWSPDGKWLAFSRLHSNSTSGVYVVAAAGGDERQITRENQDLRGLTWMPDGRTLLVSSNRAGPQRLWAVDVRSGAMRPVPTAGTSARDPAVSRDGNWLVYSDYMLQAEIWKADLKKGGARNLLPSTRQDHSAQYSPDGRSIAFVSDRSGSWELWTMSADGGNPRQITQFDGPLLGTPHWSPDGKYLAFDARPAGHSAVFVIPALGGTPRRVEEDSFEDKMPSWSHDGQWIYFNSDRAGAQELWKVPAAGGKAVRLARGFAADSLETADGREVYFQGEGGAMMRVPTAGGTAMAVRGTGTMAARRVWNLTDEGFWFVEPAENGFGLLLSDLVSGRVWRRASLEGDLMLDVPGMSVSPDGGSLIYSRRKESRSDLILIRGLERN